jgi:hypothetical protein
MENNEELKTNEGSKLSHNMGIVSWSLFLIWIGIAFLIKVNAGVTLLGFGVITLGAQVVRKCFHLKLEWFWLVIGLLFVVGGIWGFFYLKVPLIPILIIVAGLVLLISLIISLIKGER